MIVEVKLTQECKCCGSEKSIVISMQDYISWLHQNQSVQEIFPEMSPGDRELFFISGICSECWDKMFAEPASEEELNKMADELAEMHWEMQGEIERGK